MSSKFSTERKEISVVIVGAFAAANFSPEWLRRFELLSESQYEKSKVDLLTQFEVQTNLEWASISLNPVNDDASYRLSITLKDVSEYRTFKDLVISLINLNSTSVASAIGININYSTVHNSPDDWNELGHRLVPKDHWYYSLSNSEKDTKDSQRIGMTNVSVQVDKHPSAEVDGIIPELNVSATPLINDGSGKQFSLKTRLAINYHYKIQKDKAMFSCLSIVDNALDNCVNESEVILTKLFE